MALLEVTNIKKIYSTRFGGNKVQALSNVTFSVEEGEFVAIMGESGSGKTTLLNILASLDRPTSGEVLLEGKNIVYLTEKEISAFRLPGEAGCGCLGYGLLRDRSYGEYPLRERYLFRYADLSGVGCLSMASVSQSDE